MGLRNAPSVFQAFNNDVLLGHDWSGRGSGELAQAAHTLRELQRFLGFANFYSGALFAITATAACPAHVSA
ncbi:hypothetical protein NFI96_031934 [Prochilodus magdalenae]|nr:hypothetical protein NFI96_031934 [Prochilodus magdalenae]